MGTDLSESTSSDLIGRVKDNDQAAWNRLSRLYAPFVYKWVRKVGLSAEDAADIGQEVFRTVATRITDLDLGSPGSSFRAWLWKITRNKIGDRIRQLRKQETATGGSGSIIKDLAGFELPEIQDEQSDEEFKSDLFQAVLRMIQTDFKERTWRAFWLSAIEEQPLDEVADTLGMNKKAVRQAKYRVLKRIREEFGDLLR